MPTAHDHLPTLASGRWFAALPTDFAAGLLRMAQVRVLQAGQALFLRGDAACGVYAVVRGAIDISNTAGHGEQARAALLTRLEPPTWFGEIALFDGSTRTHDAHAAAACTLLHVPQEALLGWLHAHPSHWHALALLLTDKLRTAFVAIEKLAWLPAPQRLARRLVLMAEGYGQWNGERRSRRSLALSQEDLALMLGISRQTANRILKGLQERGLLQVHRGEIEICDLQGLRKASE